MAENRDPNVRDLTATVGEQLREKDEHEREASQAARQAEQERERIERHKADERATAAEHAKASPPEHAFASGAASPRRWGRPEGSGPTPSLRWPLMAGGALLAFLLAPKALRRVAVAALAIPFLAREVWPRVRAQLEARAT